MTGHDDDELRLSSSACRVFVALVRAGGHVSSASDLQRRAGVRKRDTFYVAVRELADEGLMDVERGPGKGPAGAYVGFRLVLSALVSDLNGGSELKASVVSDVSME